MGLYLPRLDATMKLVNPDGTPSQRFIIFWQFQAIRIDGAAAVNFSNEVAAAEYDPAQMQKVLDFCAALSRGIKS